MKTQSQLISNLTSAIEPVLPANIHFIGLAIIPKGDSYQFETFSTHPSKEFTHLVLKEALEHFESLTKQGLN